MNLKKAMIGIPITLLIMIFLVIGFYSVMFYKSKVESIKSIVHLTEDYDAYLEYDSNLLVAVLVDEYCYYKKKGFRNSIANQIYFGNYEEINECFKDVIERVNYGDAANVICGAILKVYDDHKYEYVYSNEDCQSPVYKKTYETFVGTKHVVLEVGYGKD